MEHVDAEYEREFRRAQVKEDRKAVKIELPKTDGHGDGEFDE